MARWLTSSGSNVIQHTVARMAIGGIVHDITVGRVAHEGVVREFWPTDASPGDSRIQWTSAPLTVTDSVEDPADAAATITFTAASGIYTYDNYPSADGAGVFLNPPVNAAGEYLIKISSDPWADLISDHQFILPQTVPGTGTSTIDISISADDGAGAPVAATTVTKSVTFIATVRDGDNAWTANEKSLETITQGEIATTELQFNPSGNAQGFADTGSFTENWSSLFPSADGTGWTVTATLVSGDTPTGSAVDTALSLDTVREWQLVADTEGEDLTCALDVIVDDGTTPITKRVNMHSQWLVNAITDPDWNTTPWSCTDAGFPQSVALLIDVHLTFAADGTAKLEAESFAMPLTVFETGTWLSGFSGDLNDYECMIDNVNGGGITTGQTEGQWVRMAEVFTVEYTTRTIAKTYTFDASVRKVGGLATTKTITVDIIKDDGGVPA